MIGHILVASDGVESRGAATVVAQLVLGADTPVEVEVLHVNEVEYESAPPGSESTEVHPEARRQVEELVADLRALGVNATGEVRPGQYETVAEDILAEAAEHGAGLIVVGSRGRTGLKAWILGSVSQEVIRRADCPVLVIHQQASGD